jgi:hypothetical protein
MKISCCDVPLTVRCRRQPLFTLLLSTFTDRYEDAHPLLSGAISSLFDDITQPGYDSAIFCANIYSVSVSAARNAKRAQTTKVVNVWVRHRACKE